MAALQDRYLSRQNANLQKDSRDYLFDSHQCVDIYVLVTKSLTWNFFKTDSQSQHLSTPDKHAVNLVALTSGSLNLQMQHSCAVLLTAVLRFNATQAKRLKPWL